MRKAMILLLTSLFLILLDKSEFLYFPEIITKETKILESYGKIPLAFTENSGQFDHKVKFTTYGNGATMFFTPEGVTFLLRREAEKAQNKRMKNRDLKEQQPLFNHKHEKEFEYYALKLKFIGANSNPEAVGEGVLPGTCNYFIGNKPDKWKTDILNYEKIRLKDLYDGIDLVYYGNKNNIKYDFVVQPGANPEQILLSYDFGEEDNGSLLINENGELEVKTPFGDIIERKPYSYQIIDGNKIEVDVHYEIVNLEKNIYAFSVGNYNPAYSIIIDPELIYSTYLGGEDYDECYDIAVDDEGNVYITGYTKSTDFPTTSGTIDESYNGIGDVFVSKLNSSGSSLVYSTYLGGGDYDEGYGIAVDTGGNVYITGYTKSNNFPITSGAFDETYNGYRDIFVSKLNYEGDSLLYSTFLGGSSYDYGYGITVDDGGNVYVTGETISSDFPTTQGAYDESGNWWSYVFVSKMNPSGSALIYSTFLSGDKGYDIAVDSNGNVYITGYTSSDYFTTTPGAFDESYNGIEDAFVSKLNSSGTTLVYSTYLGGGIADYGRGIAVDNSGNVYITGYTESTDFPTTSGALYENNIGCNDLFISKLNSLGSTLLYSTYLGGSSIDYGYDIAIDAESNVYITGETFSIDFPTTSYAFDKILDGNIDVFVSKLNSSGNALLYSTYLGGSYSDCGMGIAVDFVENMYITGETWSSDFPTTTGAFDESSSWLWPDVFISKIDITVTGVNTDVIHPYTYELYQNYPNPFNPETTIRYALPTNAEVSIKIYNITGKLVRELESGQKQAGEHAVTWDGLNTEGICVASGIYMYRLVVVSADGVVTTLTNKMTLIK